MPDNFTQLRECPCTEGVEYEKDQLANSVENEEGELAMVESWRVSLLILDASYDTSYNKSGGNF